MVEFCVLGEIAASDGGAAVELGPAQQRSVLAALLVDTPRTVSVDQLVERVWGERAPQRARGTLYSYVSRIRQALAGTNAGPVREQGGYRLTVELEAVDVFRFRETVCRARATEGGERAVVLWEEALALWQGEAFTSADTPWFNAQRAFLNAERLAAQLDLTEVRLSLGQHTQVVAECAARAESHPLDERVVGQLMLTLYRCGRQAEALECYDRTRRQLAEEMGVDLGAPLRRLHQQILTTDPELTLAPPAIAARRFARPVPQQLPAPPTAFVGRSHELAALDSLLNRSGDRGNVLVISAIGGTGGVGKSWLALHWAHEHLDRFPDGQLYAALGGFGPSNEPVPPDRVLRGFLDALGTSPQEIPADAETQAGLYRSLVADRRLLIVLDNARDADQVRLLLPGSASCMVLVTSRSHLGGLTATHGSQYLALDTFSDTDARQVLIHALGQERMAAEPAAATALLRRCAGLPLALGIIAARAAMQPAFPLAVLAEELDDATSRLDALHTGDLATDLRAVFDTSYRALDTRAAQVFALLGLAPGPDFSLPAAASLIGIPLARTRVVLRALEAVHLIQQHTPGRYRMHDLIRLYATERGHAQPADIRNAALRRLIGFYAHTACAGDRLLSPHRTPIAAGPSEAACDLPVLHETAAMPWFEAEHPCLLAAHHFAVRCGWRRQAWQLAWSLDTFHWRQGRLPDRIAMLQATLSALETPREEPATRALAHRLLGRAYVALGEHDQALDHLRQALTLFEEADDAAGTAQSHLNLALAWEQRSDDAQALAHAVQNLRIRRTLDSPPREAEALNAVGWYHARLGHHRQARSFCEQALALCRLHHFREGEAFTLDSLGFLAHRSGQHTVALDHYRQALTLRRELGDAYEEADALACLGEVHHALGRPAQAHHAWSQALDLYRGQYRTAEAHRVQELLDVLKDSRTN